MKDNELAEKIRGTAVGGGRKSRWRVKQRSENKSLLCQSSLSQK